MIANWTLRETNRLHLPQSRERSQRGRRQTQPMRRTKRAALLRPVLQPTVLALTCRSWLPILSAALLTIVGNTPLSARADENGSQSRPPRFTLSDLNMPSLTEEDDTFILPLTPALTDLSSLP